MHIPIKCDTKLSKSLDLFILLLLKFDFKMQKYCFLEVNRDEKYFLFPVDFFLNVHAFLKNNFTAIEITDEKIPCVKDYFFKNLPKFLLFNQNKADINFVLLKFFQFLGS